MSMKVCFLLSRLPIGESGVLVGGAAANCASLALELRRKGIDIEVLSPVFKEDEAFLALHPLSEIVKPVPLEVVSLFRRGIISLRALRHSLKTRMQEVTYNVVHSHSGTYPYAMAALAGKRNGCARLHSLYCPLGEKGGVYGSWWEMPLIARLVLTRLDKIIAVTQNVFDSVLTAGICRTKLEIVPMAVDSQRFYPRGAVDINRYFLGASDAFKILFVGNASKEKGLMQLLDATRILLEKGLRINVVAMIENQSKIYEYSMEEEYARAWIREHKLASHVRVVGLVPRIEEIYSEADIVILPWNTSRGPSDHPMVALEAMAMGKLIVSTRVGGIPELLRGGKAGILAEGFCGESLARAIQFIIDRPGLRKQIEDAALSVSERFSAALVTNRILSVYDNILRSRPS